MLDQPLSVAGGHLEAGKHAVGLRLPSWSPGSAGSTVAWEARLRVERDGRDVEASAPLTALVAAPNPAPTEAVHSTLEWLARIPLPLLSGLKSFRASGSSC